MNILRVIASMDPISGGPCQGIRNAIPALKELGVRNEVVCMDDSQAEFMNKDTFVIHALGPAKNAWAYGPRLMPWLKENLHRFDAVIVHGLWLYPGYAIYQAYKSINGTRPKLFVMPHGMLDPYFQRSNSRRLKALRNWFYWKLIEKKVIHRADGIFFTCEQELLLAQNTFRPYEPKNQINVAYGVPQPPALSAAMSEKFLELCPEAKNRNFLLFLSRIHEKKGVDLLIEAYLRMKKKYLKEQLPLLIIAGPGMDTRYGRRLKRLVESNPMLNESVFFLGMLTGDAKWGAFYGCEAFVLPSHQENFGIAVVEALACSKPVLISDQVNIWREVEKSECGIIAKDNLDGVLSLMEIWNNLSINHKNSMALQARISYNKFFATVLHIEKLVKAIK